jgi:hypothetical protein
MESYRRLGLRAHCAGSWQAVFDPISKGAVTRIDESINCITVLYAITPKAYSVRVSFVLIQMIETLVESHGLVVIRRKDTRMIAGLTKTGAFGWQLH